MKKAMITIEVLVAMLILFLVIATSFSNISFFNILNEKKKTYEDTYMNVLSIKDKLSLTLCTTTMRQEGTFNNISYIATCDKEKELRTFTMGMELDDPSGNVGRYLIKLYTITLELQEEKSNKAYSYLLTRSEKINDE